MLSARRRRTNKPQGSRELRVEEEQAERQRPFEDRGPNEYRSPVDLESIVYTTYIRVFQHAQNKRKNSERRT